MEINHLKSEILKFLKERNEKEYTTTQITSSLGLKKDCRIEIQELLNKLCAEGNVKKISKRYSYTQEIDNEDIQSSTTTITNYEGNKRYLSGKFDATPIAKNLSFAFVITEDDNDVFISTEDTLNAYHGDIVEVELTSGQAHKRYGIITKIIKRSKDKFVGIIEKVQNKKYFRSDNLKIHTLFDVYEDKNTPEGYKVQVEVINWGIRQKNRLPMCNVIEIMGVSGEPEVEILSVIREFDLPLEFPDEVINEANAISHEITDEEISRRHDLRELYTITIDPVSAKDFDDAISLIEDKNGELLLYVHIADVAHYIKPDMNLFHEAVNRGNSYYFPKKVIPMLPEVLSNKLCSLRPQEEKYTLTVLTKFSKDGKIIKQEIFESVIKSDIRLAYEEVDVYFEKMSATESINSIELLNTLDIMRKLSKRLSLSKNQRGYLKFDLPEVEYIYDDEGYICDIIRTSETESHVLIENFMLIANEYVAKILTEKAKNTMYRIHEKPEENDLKKIRDILKSYDITFQTEDNINKTWQNILECLPDERFHRVFDRMILRSMKKAKYSINNLGHFGLGLANYTHFTSPIRRLCDLIIHLQLKGFIFGENGFDKNHNKKLMNYAGVATEREAIADDAERLMESKILMSFMKKKIGKTFNAIINGMNNNTIFIELDEIPVRGVIKLKQLNDDYYTFNEFKHTINGRRKGQTFKLCDKIEVILVNVSDDIYFDIVCKNAGGEHNHNSKYKKEKKHKGRRRRY